MTDFTLATDADGVATITWDVAQKSMNVMSTEGFALLASLFDQALAVGARLERARRKGKAQSPEFAGAENPPERFAGEAARQCIPNAACCWGIQRVAAGEIFDQDAGFEGGIGDACLPEDPRQCSPGPGNGIAHRRCGSGRGVVGRVAGARQNGPWRRPLGRISCPASLPGRRRSS